MAQLVYFVVYGGVLFYINILSGHIRFGLIIVVIGNEILNGVFRKKLAELAAKLCRKSFVGCQHQSGTVCVCNYICHGKGLARARHTHKGLKALTCLNTGAELVYCLRLISRGSIR